MMVATRAVSLFGAPPLRNIKNLTEANNQDQTFLPTTED
jgi:hypothetical protein